ncbi:MAG: ribbon-helix-helix protein, CopG family [Myxococcales bacterium]|nr:ribbon-helix-helix protein, CopG family [Myxococcales bacterium]MDD9971400.1 ribbon-helix-helix protein, CopG family [Myxococcales bacterium]
MTATRNPHDVGERINARLDAEESELLERARALTGKSTSAIIKEALRLYCADLPRESPLEIFVRHGVVGAIEGPEDLSESYKDRVDFSKKAGRT